MKPMFWTQPHSLTEWTCIIRNTKEKLRHISHNIIKFYVWKESSLMYYECPFKQLVYPTKQQNKCSINL